MGNASILFLACLACVGHASRVRDLPYGQRGSIALPKSRQRPWTVDIVSARNLSKPLSSFARLLLALNPSIAFNFLGCADYRHVLHPASSSWCRGTASLMQMEEWTRDDEEQWITEDTSTTSSGAFGAETIRLKAGSVAYMVGADIRGNKYKTLEDSWTVHNSLDELQRLSETADLRVVGRCYQAMQHPAAGTFIGSGKLKALQENVTAMGVQVVVFDEELTPAQSRNLEEVFGEKVQVIDRTMLTLFVFGQRARTKEAKLQVAAAEASYMMPRLSYFLTEGAGMESTGGAASGGGQYMKGAGETQIEMDRRLFRERIRKINQEIAGLQTRRDLYRQKRRKNDAVAVVAIVGYTNAGKSTLFNTLVGRNEVYADDLLFATLDATTRRISLPAGKQVLITDTVGFMQKLPTKLIASFRATLDEVVDAAVVVHIVDGASPLAVQQVRSVQSIITDLEANDTPQVLVINKEDQLESDPERLEAIYEMDWGGLDPNVDLSSVVEISALQGDGIDKLLRAVEEALFETCFKVDCVLPYAEAALNAEVNRVGLIKLEEYFETGTHLVAYVPVSVRNRLKKVAVEYREELPRKMKCEAEMKSSADEEFSKRSKRK